MVKPVTENVRIGPAGWQYSDWGGVVYPTPRPRGFDALEFIASYFNVIEINSTFYRTPSRQTAQSWAERVAHLPRFRFTLKALNRFTHGAGDTPTAELEAFKLAISPLEEAGRLSCILLQFPWSFKDTAASRHRIDELARAFAPFPVAVEVRHGSWALDDAWRHLESTGYTVCGIDQPVIGDSLRPGRFITGDAGTYVRLHGRNYRDWFSNAGRDARYDYLYSRDQLQPWVDVITRSAAAGHVNVILNNHFRGQAPANAFEMMSMLTGQRVEAPSRLVRTYPRLGEIADVRGDPTVADGWLFDPLPAEDDQGEHDDPGHEGDLDRPR